MFPFTKHENILHKYKFYRSGFFIDDLNFGLIEMISILFKTNYSNLKRTNMYINVCFLSYIASPIEWYPCTSLKLYENFMLFSFRLKFIIYTLKCTLYKSINNFELAIYSSYLCHYT